MKVKISIIVAMAENGVIGHDGAMPWHMPSDLKFFKQTTMGKPVIMGRKTWGSLQKKPLPGRTNIVVSRDKDNNPSQAISVQSLDDACQIGAVEANKIGMDEIFIIGGGEIYKQALAFADQLFVTKIAAKIEGDTFFPKIDDKIWHILESYPLQKTEKDSHFAKIIHYERLF